MGFNGSTSTYDSLIGMGKNHSINGSQCSVIVGGLDNDIFNVQNGFIGGGGFNSICNTGPGYSTLVGGQLNTINGSCMNFIGGGQCNSIGPQGAFGGIIGGFQNNINHNESFAIGSNISSSAHNTTYMNSGSFDGFVDVVGDVTANDFITTSDRNLKSNIQEIGSGLDVIKQFTAYEYEKSGRQDAGFIAQEVAEAIPYAVFTGSNGYLTMTDRPVLAHMHNAILELEKRIKSIEESLNI